MFFSSLSIISPSLWFISALGLAQTTVPNRPPSKKSVKMTAVAAPKVTAVKATRPSCEDTLGQIKDAACIVKELQSIYQAASSMTATFTQAYTYAVYQRTQISSGALFLKKPGRMRWDYKKPQSKVFVSNGDDLWVYEPEKNQAYKKSLQNSELPIAISFLMGKGNLLDEFKPTLGAVTADTITVNLMPLEASRHYKELKLTINRTSFIVSKSAIVDPANNTNTVTFSNVVIDASLPDSGFEFSPPKGVNVLR
jgi:outer membrane lipoprotein carrier protein